MQALKGRGGACSTAEAKFLILMLFFYLFLRHCFCQYLYFICHSPPFYIRYILTWVEKWSKSWIQKSQAKLNVLCPKTALENNFWYGGQKSASHLEAKVAKMPSLFFAYKTWKFLFSWGFLYLEVYP